MELGAWKAQLAAGESQLGRSTLYEKRNHPGSHFSYPCGGRLQQRAVEQFHFAGAGQQAGSGFRW